LQEFFVEFFGSFSRLIVFFHVLSASILIGGMFALRFIIKPVLTLIDDEEIRFKRCLDLMDRFAKLMLPIMLLLISASLLMTVGLGFEYASPITSTMIHIKEAIWLFIAFNFGFMYWKFLNARQSYKKRDFFEVEEHIILIVNFLIPLNLLLSLAALYIGIVIRGF
jgi:uncharacterized membrane protein